MDSQHAGPENYRWFPAQYGHWVDFGYCVTSVTRSTPAQVLDTLKADRRSRLKGVKDFFAEAMNAWDERGGGAFGRLPVLVTAVGTSTLMLEVNGFIGTTDKMMLPLSEDRDVANCYYSVGVHRFSLWKDGRLELACEPPALVEACYGSDPHKHIERMLGLGLAISDPTTIPVDTTQAMLAYAELLTGVTVTPTLLETATFESGRVQTLHS